MDNFPVILVNEKFSHYCIKGMSILEPIFAFDKKYSVNIRKEITFHIKRLYTRTLKNGSNNKFLVNQID